jgi:predicted PurR-regulated permease PerM
MRLYETAAIDILIHKLEYFVNARVIGGRIIHDRAWELLLAMLVMETMFGIPGLIAAPIYYSRLKKSTFSSRPDMRPVRFVSRRCGTIH